MNVPKMLSKSSELPEEVLIEILLRLPVKSLIRFTSVCKYWFSLIKSSQFATKQFYTRINLLQQNDSHFFLTFSSHGDPIAKFLSYETLEIFSTFECKPVDNHWDSVYCVSWSFSGPCNGILCVEVCKMRSVLLLWNPATREVFVLNQPSQILNFVGFGFDHKTNDYKIVMFDYSGNVQLYSLVADSWRGIEADFPLGEDKDIFVQIDPTSNGRMYNWMVYDSSSNGLCLLSFDMVDEVFIETPMPEGVQGCYLCFLQQCSNHMFPALLCFDLINCCSRAARVDVWVLDEYGPNGHWTKQRSLGWPEHIILGPPRGLWKNEGILFIGQERVLSYYNTVTQEIRSLHVPGQQLIGYTESLISIKDVCQTRELKGPLISNALQQARGLEDLDEDDEDQSVQDIAYHLCEANQPALSNCVTF
ncbi:hypothetical protein RDABS01_022687 [Bienertia sinuspersici]